MPSVFTVINLEAAFFGFSTHHCVVLPSKRERARASFLLISVLYISIITWGLCGKKILEIFRCIIVWAVSWLNAEVEERREEREEAGCELTANLDT